MTQILKIDNRLQQIHVNIGIILKNSLQDLVLMNFPLKLVSKDLWRHGRALQTGVF